MLVLTRYRVADDEAVSFAAQADAALTVLSTRPGFVDGQVARNVDDPQLWTLTTRWDGVGSYRRALSSYDVKVRAVPVMYLAIDEPTAYEALVSTSPDGLVDAVSDRAEGAASASPHDGGRSPGGSCCRVAASPSPTPSLME